MFWFKRRLMTPEVVTIETMIAQINKNKKDIEELQEELQVERIGRKLEGYWLSINKKIINHYSLNCFVWYEIKDINDNIVMYLKSPEEFDIWFVWYEQWFWDIEVTINCDIPDECVDNWCVDNCCDCNN